MTDSGKNGLIVVAATGNPGKLREIGEITAEFGIKVISKKDAGAGDIEIEGDMEVLGRVEGNIRCSGKLVVGGLVNGDIVSGDLFISNGHVEGRISSKGLVKISEGSVSVGNIEAQSAHISGAIKGDIDVSEDVEVGPTAVIVGNIKSKSVQISSGAIVNGMCQQTYAQVDLDQYFSEEIEDLDINNIK